MVGLHENGNAPLLWELALELEESDDSRLLGVAEQLHALAPELPAVGPLLAFGCLQQGLLASARQALQRCGADAAKAADPETVKSLLNVLEDVVDLENLDRDVAREGVLRWLREGRLRRAERAARQGLQRFPQDPNLLVNLAAAQFLQGRDAVAVSTLLELLEFEPENVQALANLVRFQAVAGKLEEAQAWAERLKACESWPDLRGISALAQVGDDDGVLQAFNAAPNSLRTAEMFHLAGVACARLGRWDEALEHWETAIDLAPGVELAEANLQNAALPVGERCEAWSFGLLERLPIRLRETLAGKMQQVAAGKRNVKAPELKPFVPLLLSLGAPSDIEFVLEHVPFGASDPETRTLCAFGLSSRGSDRHRLRALQKCRELGVLSVGPHQFWSEGRATERELLFFQVHGRSPIRPHPRAVEELLPAIMEALRHDRLAEAEGALRRCIELDPRGADLHNHLARIYYLQGRSEEALSVLERIAERQENYLLTHATRANILAAEGDLEGARLALRPLLESTSLHYMEFSALCDLRVRLARLAGDEQVVESWKDLWESLERHDADAQPYRPSCLASDRPATEFRRALPWSSRRQPSPEAASL